MAEDYSFHYGKARQLIVEDNIANLVGAKKFREASANLRDAASQLLIAASKIDDLAQHNKFITKRNQDCSSL